MQVLLLLSRQWVPRSSTGGVSHPGVAPLPVLTWVPHPRTAVAPLRGVDGYTSVKTLPSCIPLEMWVVIIWLVTGAEPFRRLTPGVTN